MSEDGRTGGTPRWLVTGARGQLGSDLLRVLAERAGGEQVTGLGRAELDLTDPVAVDSVLDDLCPDVVFNAAAYTAVDAAESDEPAAVAGNVTGPANLARACAARQALLVHVSTDYVFSGQATEPYPTDAPTCPRSAYGRTKLAGERAVRELCPRSHVVRTAWVYGQTGGNFVRTMVRLEAERDTLDVVDDQRGSPTWSRDLAGGLVALACSGARPGVYHCTNGGDTTWYGLARAVFEELGADPSRVRPTTSDRFVRPAPRPAYSVLSDAAWLAAGLPPMPHWRDALHTAFATVGQQLRG
ncbi:MAG TPA: dTDP-4-dehydrorhamnose reductase [Mycobacteriales bacterium]